MLIQDPYSDRTVDVTGWHLDALAETLRTLRADLTAEVVRELTHEETDALTGPGGLGADWIVQWTDYPRVADALARYEAIVTEAILQRDLATALPKLSTGQTLTGPERTAFDTYVREAVYDR